MMKRGEVIVLFLSGLLILSMAFLGVITGGAVDGSDADVFDYIIRGSEEEPKFQCQLEPLKNKPVKIKDVDGSLIMDCSNVVGLCSDSDVGSKYAEIMIGQGGGRCIYFNDKVENYVEGTRISYNSVARKISIIGQTAKEKTKVSSPWSFLTIPVREKCVEEINVKINPKKTKYHGSILNIEVSFKCKDDKVPPNAIIKYAGKEIGSLSLVPQGNRKGVYSNVYLTENSGKHEIIIQYGKIRERFKVKV